jgi:hypothetical protein
METLTSLETASPQNQQAISTPREINYRAAVKSCAERKSKNGAMFTSQKGKSDLLKLTVDCVKSLLGLGRFDEQGNKILLPIEHFNAIKREINTFWESEAISIIRNGQERGGKVSIRRGVLGSKVNSKGVIERSKTDKVTVINQPEAKEHRLCDMFGLAQAEKRMDAMLDNVGKYDRAQLTEQSEKVAILRLAVHGAEKPVEESK